LGLLEESQFCQSNGLEFLSFPIEDRSVPSSFNEIEGLLNSVTDYLRNGKAVGVHCRAGIGRSSMIVASALIRNGLSVDSAFSAIQEARGCSVPDTPEQRQWVERYSSRLGRAEK
jgi:protein-tyrosine phosphatase